MSAQHTPGPWHCIGNAIGTESCEIATVWNATDSPNPYYEKRANARLIAVAPDLLAALEALFNPDLDIEATLTDADQLAVIDMARRAIAKAKVGFQL